MERLPDPLHWLEHGLPLTLLIDLLDSAGPDSQAILREEPADVRWVRRDEAA